MSNKDMKQEQKSRSGGGMGHGPGGHGVGQIEKPKDFKGGASKLIKYLKPYYFKMIIVLIFAIASTIFAIVGPTIMIEATNLIFYGFASKMQGGAGIDFQGVARVLLTLVTLYVISSIFSFIQSYIMTGVSQKVSYDLRESLAVKVNKLPLSFFDKNSSGDILSRFTNDVDTIGQSLGQTISQFITSITSVIGILIMMLRISPLMTVTALFILALSLFVVMLLVKNSQGFFKQQQKYLGIINGQVEETYGGHMVVKAFNAEEDSLKQFTKSNDVLYNTAWKSQFMSSIMMPAMNLIGNIGYVLVSVLGSYLTIKKVIEVGDILAFIQYIRNFTQPIAQAAQTANVMQSTVAAAERVFDFLAEKEEIPETNNPQSTSYIKGDVSFENVHFGYEEGKIIINDFSFDVKPGQKIAIVGPTGAGKTTLAKLLLRFYELNSGLIKIDGIDIKDFKRNDLRGLIGMVLQDTWLFNGSIGDNIRYGKLGSSDEEVKTAAKSAYADRFIRTLPEAYDFNLNEEVSNISSGQKQLLTIARAILSDPKILILDEATSSVDTRTEVLIQKAMNKLMVGRTSFIIAHRLSTIRDADSILVLNNGDIVEQGNHEELLAKGGFYSNLYNSQFEM